MTPANTPVEKSVDTDTLPGFFHAHRSWLVSSVVAAIMVMLALLGVGLTTASSSAAPTYWISLVPFFGLLCVGVAWNRARNTGKTGWNMVWRQIFHWLGIGVALGVDFYIRQNGQESGVGAGLNAMLLLAVGCYLAGVHLDWLFAIVGILLSIVLVILTKADQYLWLIFVVGGLAIVVMLGLNWYIRVARAKQLPAEKPATSTT